MGIIPIARGNVYLPLTVLLLGNVYFYMKRRDVLVKTGVAASVAGLAGCSALPGGGNSKNNSNSEIVDSVRVVEHDMSYTGGSENGDILFAYVTGELLNVSSEEIESVVVKVDFKRQGEIIATNTDAVGGLTPEETFAFSVQFPSPPDKPRLAGTVDEYKITIHESAENLDIEVPEREDSETPTPDQPEDAEPPETSSSGDS